MFAKRLVATLIALTGAGVAGSAHAALELNMPRGVTEISREVYDLHMLIFWICVVIGIVVFGAMIWSLVYHRKSRGAKAANFHESTTVEIIWTLLPFVILIGMAIPAAGTLIKMEDTRNSDMTIKATGYQWLWEYEYLDHGVQFYSRLDNASNEARQLDSGIDPASVDDYLLNVDKRVVVPVGKKIRLLLTSNDVIHAWWVPDLGGKKDAIPGYINEMWFQAEEPGVYRGQCAELCGRGHAYMPIVVEAVPQAEFETWVSEQGGNPSGESEQVADASASTQAQATASDASGAGQAAGEGNSEPAADMSQGDLMAQGEKVYKTQCAVCHQADGSGLESAGFPSLKGSPIATGPVEAHIKQTLNGQNAMPPFKDTLSDAEIAAVITYERNSFGNDTGDTVQPAQVNELR